MKKTIKKQTKKELPTLQSELKKIKETKEVKKTAVKKEKKLVVTPEMINYVYHICYVDKGNKFNSLIANLPFSLSNVEGVTGMAQYLRKITNDNYRALCSYQFVCEVREKDLVKLEEAGLIRRSERS